MKKTIMLTGITVLLLTFSSCLTTLYPLFKPGDVLFEPKLLGAWRSDGSDEVVRFERASKEAFGGLSPELQALADKAYIVTTTGNEGRIEEKYYAFVLRLGKNLYVDYFPVFTPDQAKLDLFYRAHYVPEHSIYKVQLKSNGQVEFRMFDGGYMDKLIKEKKIRIRHEQRDDDGMLITATTEELQQYVLKYGDVQSAYEDANVYTKIN